MYAMLLPRTSLRHPDYLQFIPTCHFTLTGVPINLYSVGL